MGLNNFFFYFFKEARKEAWKSRGDLREEDVQAFKMLGCEREKKMRIEIKEDLRERLKKFEISRVSQRLEGLDESIISMSGKEQIIVKAA